MDQLPNEIKLKVLSYADSKTVFATLRAPSFHPLIAILYKQSTLAELIDIYGRDVFDYCGISKDSLVDQISSSTQILTSPSGLCMIRLDEHGHVDLGYDYDPCLKHRTHLLLTTGTDCDYLKSWLGIRTVSTEQPICVRRHVELVEELTKSNKLMFVGLKVVQMELETNDFFDPRAHYYPHMAKIDIENCDLAAPYGTLLDFPNLNSLSAHNVDRNYFKSFDFHSFRNLTRLDLQLRWWTNSDEDERVSHCIENMTFPSLKEAHLNDLIYLRNIDFPVLQLLTIIITNSDLLGPPSFISISAPDLEEFTFLSSLECNPSRVSDFNVGESLKTLNFVSPYENAFGKDYSFMRNVINLETKPWCLKRLFSDDILNQIESLKLTFTRDYNITLDLGKLRDLTLTVEAQCTVLPKFPRSNLEKIHLTIKNDGFFIGSLKALFTQHVKSLTVIKEKEKWMPMNHQKPWSKNIIESFPELESLTLEGFDIELNEDKQMELPPSVKRLNISKGNRYHTRPLPNIMEPVEYMAPNDGN